MAVGKKGSSIADAGFSFAGGAPADCDEFAERVFIADFQVSRFALVFQVLRLLTDRAGGIKFISFAGAHRSTKRDMLLQPAILAEHDIGCDHAIWSDGRSCADFRSWIDSGR